MTLAEFHASPDWRMTFDIAFGLGLRDTQDPEYFGPVQAVAEVLACNRTVDSRGYAWAAVRFNHEDSPHDWAVVWSRFDGKDPTGEVVYYATPFAAIASGGVMDALAAYHHDLAARVHGSIAASKCIAAIQAAVGYQPPQ